MFAFRYKLTLLFAGVVLLMLGGALVVIQSGTTGRFNERIEADLARTANLIDAFMHQRHQLLADNGYTLTGDGLILEMLRDTTLDAATRQDLIRNEVHPAFDFIDGIVLTDSKGAILAESCPEGFAATLIESPIYARAATGKQAQGLIFLNGQFIQAVASPVYIQRELYGTVFVCLDLDAAFLQSVRDLADVEVMLLNGSTLVTSTIQADDHELETLLKQSSRAEVQHTVIRETDYLWQRIAGEPDFVPDYLIARSLRKDLAFLGGLKKRTLTVGVTGLLMAILLGLFISSGVTRPIAKLVSGMKHVRDGDLSHRLAISSRDEFQSLADSFNTMTAGMEEKERIRGLMNKVVSEDIATEMLSGKLQLGGEERIATVLFSDIRGFTTMAEGLPPATLLQIVNRYFQHMSGCIDRNHGVIDKYIGDAIMALFGLPLSTGDDAHHAILAALDMIKQLEKVNRELAGILPQPITIGIGINTGTVVAGNMGADDRLNYSVLGDQVNLTARVEGLTKAYATPLLITQSTAEAVRTSGHQLPYLLRSLDTVQVSGKTEPTRLFDVIPLDEGGHPEEFIAQFERAHAALHARDFARATDLFRALHLERPTDGPTKTFLARAERYSTDQQCYERENVSGTHVFKRK